MAQRVGFGPGPDSGTVPPALLRMTALPPRPAGCRDLRVIDTQGSPLLQEVAVLDGRGQLLPW